MTLHKFQTEAANFRDNPNVLIDEDNKTIWRILCQIPVRRNDNDAVDNRKLILGHTNAAASQNVA